MCDAIELSGNPEQVTTPVRKRIYRIIDKDNGHAEGEYIALDYKNLQEEKHLKMFYLVHTYSSKFVTNITAKELQQDIVVNGSILYEEPTFQEIQVYVEENLHLLWSEYKRTTNPEEHLLDLSQACWESYLLPRRPQESAQPERRTISRYVTSLLFRKDGELSHI